MNKVEKQIFRTIGDYFEFLSKRGNQDERRVVAWLQDKFEALEREAEVRFTGEKTLTEGEGE